VDDRARDQTTAGILPVAVGAELGSDGELLGEHLDFGLGVDTGEVERVERAQAVARLRNQADPAAPTGNNLAVPAIDVAGDDRARMRQ
jgi:hypothetical protein